MRTEPFELSLRVVVDAPLPGVAMAMQHGDARKAHLVRPVETRVDALVFDFMITVHGATKEGQPRLLGPFVQGPPEGRFVYINSGTSAGQFGSPWTRRLKVPLSGLTWAMLEEVRDKEPLTAHVAGVARDGGPACASVKLVSGWTKP